ncbi:nitroreductase family protein [Floridanema evergladense]|uniref:Nitroreductase family protein n=1 Tax=Floridaenema evergladense BLCC-F167 TaxID=3153639 RepID=A0ABV4WT14_9CYAN
MTEYSCQQRLLHFFTSCPILRVSRLYPYSSILKNVGAVFQTMYLVATSLDLAPCAIGCGNADLFASAFGTDYYTESSVGEFALSSRV